MTKSFHKKFHMAGVTLVELMIAVAIIAVIAAIAIPAYNGYIKEARIATARSNIDSLRLFMEDYRLDNDCYSALDANGVCSPGNYSGVNAIENVFGWNPKQDDSDFNYILNVTNDAYQINVTYSGGWVNCSESSNCSYSP